MAATFTPPSMLAMPYASGAECRARQQDAYMAWRGAQEIPTAIPPAVGAETAEASPRASAVSHPMPGVDRLLADIVSGKRAV